MVHRAPLPPAPAGEAASERPSKSQRKRDMTALQDLGESLLRLTSAELARIDLPEELRQAITGSARITSHEARRRHLQYIGKLMRQVDADEVRAAIGRATGESRAAVALMHLAERWRDRLLADDEALTAFMSERPGADVQWLRAAIRAARREHAAGQPPKHARALYRWLHDQLAPHASREDAHEG